MLRDPHLQHLTLNLTPLGEVFGAELVAGIAGRKKEGNEEDEDGKDHAGGGFLVMVVAVVSILIVMVIVIMAAGCGVLVVFATIVIVMMVIMITRLPVGVIVGAESEGAVAIDEVKAADQKHSDSGDQGVDPKTWIEVFFDPPRDIEVKEHRSPRHEGQDGQKLKEFFHGPVAGLNQRRIQK